MADTSERPKSVNPVRSLATPEERAAVLAGLNEAYSGSPITVYVGALRDALTVAVAADRAAEGGEDNGWD